MMRSRLQCVTLVLFLAASLWSASASAQVITSFSASPTLFEAGSGTTFSYSIEATTHPLLGFGNGPLLVVLDLLVDYGDGLDELIHSGVYHFDFASFSFDHLYSQPGVYTATATASGIWQTDIFVFGTVQTVQDGFLAVDQLTLTAVTAAAAPGPATYVLLLVGVAMVGFAVRRQKH